MINNSSIKFLSQKSFDDIKEKVLNSDEIFNKEQEKKFIKDEIIAKDKLNNFDSIYLNYNIKYLKKEHTELNNPIINDKFCELNSINKNSYLNNNDKDSYELFKDIDKYLFYDNNDSKKININNYREQKRRNIFGVIYPNKFIIFNRGGYNASIRQFINNIFYKEKKYKNLFFLKEKKSRKNNAVNIRKKIKARFLKTLQKTINNKLKLGGSEKLFNFLQQKFVINLSREMNRDALHLSFKEIFSKNFSESIKENDVNMKKYYYNISVLDYLEKNKDISEKSNYIIFKDMKYYQIFEEYLNSKEFEIEISCLRREKGVDDKYIKKYIKLAYTLNDFFCQ